MKASAGTIIMFFVFLQLIAFFILVEFYIAPVEELTNSKLVGFPFEKDDLERVKEAKLLNSEPTMLRCMKLSDMQSISIECSTFFENINDKNFFLTFKIRSDSKAGSAKNSACDINNLPKNSGEICGIEISEYGVWQPESMQSTQACIRASEKFDHDPDCNIYKQLLARFSAGTKALYPAMERILSMPVLVKDFKLRGFSIIEGEDSRIALRYAKVSSTSHAAEIRDVEITDIKATTPRSQYLEPLKNWECFIEQDANNMENILCSNIVSKITFRYAGYLVCRLQDIMNPKLSCEHPAESQSEKFEFLELFIKEFDSQQSS